MANDHETTVGIGIKTYLEQSIAELTNFNKLTEKSGEILERYEKKAKLFNRFAYALEKMANVNMNRLNESLNKTDDYLGAMNEKLQSVNAQNFNRNVKVLEAGVRSYNNILRSLSKSNSLAGEQDSETPISIPAIDMSAYQKMVTDISGLDINAFARFASGLRNFVNSTNYLKELKIDDTVIEDMKTKMDKIASVYTAFIEKMNGMDLSSFSEGMKAIAKVPTAMKKMETLNAEKIGQAFDTITQKIRSFIVTLNEGEGSLKSFATITTNFSSFNSGMARTRKEVDNLGASSDKTKKKLSNMLSFGKLYALYNQVRHFGSGFVNMLNKSIDFTEIENYFSRAMGNMRKEAMKFQNQLSDMYGLAMPDMMKAQATFKNMLGSFGDLGEQASYKLSEQLTKMSLDFASLYNVSFDSALTKFQAALSKQVKICPLCMGMHSESPLTAGSLNTFYVQGNQQPRPYC